MPTIPKASFVPSAEDLWHRRKIQDEREAATQRAMVSIAKFQAILAEEMAAWRKECDEEKERHAANRAIYGAIDAATKAVDTAKEEMHVANLAAISARKQEKCDARAKLVAAQAKLDAAQEALRMAKNKDKKISCFCSEILRRTEEAQNIRSLREAYAFKNA